MPIYTMEDYPVYSKYYYVVDFKNLLKVRLLPYYFINKEAARRAKKLNFPPERLKYIEVMRGKKLKAFLLTYKMSQRLGKYIKYDYPAKDLSRQAKKSIRTQIRRRLRRMGIYTRVKPKYSIKEKPKVIKAVENKQKVAITKNTLAQVIRLERKPHVYYWIKAKSLAKKKGYLFSLFCIKFDLSNNKCSEVILNTKRTDIMIPYLITELEAILDEKIKEIKKPGQRKKKIAYYRSFGFRVHDLF